MNRRGQNITEYAIILTVVTTAVFAMSTYFKRGVQGVAKATVDELGGIAEREYRLIRDESVNGQKLGAADMGMVKATFQPQTISDKMNSVVAENRGTITRESSQVTAIAASSSGTYVSYDPASSYFDPLQNKEEDSSGSSSSSSSSDSAGSPVTKPSQVPANTYAQ